MPDNTEGQRITYSLYAKEAKLDEVRKKELELCAKGWHAWDYKNNMPAEIATARKCKICGIEEIRVPRSDTWRQKYSALTD